MEPEKENIVTTKKPESKKMNFSLSLDFRLLAGVLLVVIMVMLFLWKPWQASPKASDRTITVTGESTITSAPDEYLFYPGYQFKNADKETALSDLTKLDNTIVAHLKSLGVPDSKIKTDSNGYNSLQPVESPDGTSTYNLSYTITIADKKLAQKVQDYLVTTKPINGVSPNANFSEAKTKQLQGQGREQATKDARAKADQSAKSLGFKVSGVKSVDDTGSVGMGGCNYSLCASPATMDLKVEDGASSSASAPSLSVQSGENKLSYSVKVVYYIR